MRSKVACPIWRAPSPMPCLEFCLIFRFSVRRCKRAVNLRLFSRQIWLTPVVLRQGLAIRLSALLAWTAGAYALTFIERTLAGGGGGGKACEILVQRCAVAGDCGADAGMVRCLCVPGP